MKLPEHSLQELKLVISAIYTARKEWLASITIKAEELKNHHPDLSQNEATKMAVCSKDVLEHNEKVINLYGILGNQAGEYIQALESLTVVSEDTLKKAA